MNDWHCQGCRGRTRDDAARCPGLPVPDGAGVPGATELTLHHHLRKLSWRVRAMILLGRPVCVDIDYRSGVIPDGPGPARAEPDASDLNRYRGPDDLLGPGGPWKDLT